MSLLCWGEGGFPSSQHFDMVTSAPYDNLGCKAPYKLLSTRITRAAVHRAEGPEFTPGS